MALRLSSLSERLRGSLFFVPMAYVVGGLLLGVLGVELDRQVVDTGSDLPFGLTSTVDSARAVLETVGGATITFAGIAFSISLLVIQLASSQYSPRVVHGLLRDPFTKRVMGIVVGTFTYCLVVLRSVRGPLEESGDPVIPNVSVGLAVLLGVVAIMATISFIDHSAHSMDVSRILSRATSDAISSARRLWDDEAGPGSDPVELPDPGPAPMVIDHAADGWIKQIHLDGILAATPPGATVRLDTEVGRYAVSGTPLCTIWPASDDVDTSRRAREAVVTGRTRTVERDVGYGVRQLADVALRALSPGVNDPTTAQDAVFHLGSVLHELLVRHPPRLVSQHAEGRTLVRPERLGHLEVVALAFDEVRLAAVGMPTVCIYLLEVLQLLRDSLPGGPSTPAGEAIRRQAALIRASVDHADLGAHDADRIRDAHDRRFGPPVEHPTA